MIGPEKESADYQVALPCACLLHTYRFKIADATRRKSAEFRALNPLGQIPVLRDADVLLADSNAIMVYLVKRYAPTSDWLPDDPVTAAAVQRCLSIAAGEVRYDPAMARGALQWNMPGDPALAAEIAGRLLGFVEQHLSDRNWLAASHITLADLACYSYVAHAPEGGIRLEPYPCVGRWLATVEAQP
jgi:glutathione S-transferase